MASAPSGNGNGNGRLSALPDKLIKALPPAMLVLVLFNVGTLGAMLYVVNHNMTARNVMIERIIDKCLVQQQDGRPRAAPNG